MTHLATGMTVSGRGRPWTILALTTFDECTAVRLRGAGDTAERTLLVPFDRLRPIPRAAGIRVVRRRRWARDVARLVSRAHPWGSLRTAAASGIDVLPYQLEPALAISRGATRVLIADAVGLGKTIQAGLVLREVAGRMDQARALVVTPAGLRDQWRGELGSRFALDATIADAAWLRRAVHELPPDVNPWVLPGIYVTSFDFLKRPEVLHPVEDLSWDVLVVDEAHNATLGTARRAAVQAAARRARRVVLLTATPHGGDTAQFEALCDLGAHEPSRDPIVVFRRTRADAGAATPRRTSLLSIRLSSAERLTHRLLDDYTARVWREAGSRSDTGARLAAIVLRKRALSSAASLASSAARRLELLDGATPRTDVQLLLPLGDEDAIDDEAPDGVLAVPGLADAAAERAALCSIVAAARGAALRESKIAFLLRLLRRLREPAIVFTEFRDTLERLRQALARAGLACEVLHGAQPPLERERSQAAFTGGTSLVLLATDAASEGLNLHARCRVVIHYELPWSPARLEQRTGRVDRIGQSRVVHEILLVARDTAERLVLAPLARKAARARTSLHPTSRLFDLLTESRVASAIVEGARTVDLDAGAPPPTAVVRVETLRAEADVESSRIALVRRCLHLAGSRGGAADGGLIVSAGPPPKGHSRGITAVYRLTLTSLSGTVEHEQLLVATDRDEEEMPRRLARGEARQVATCWRRTRDAEARRVLLAFCDEHLSVVRAAHLEGIGSLERREDGIARAASTTARQLVQAGLFDRRAVRLQSSRRRAAGALLDESEHRRAQLASHGRLTTTIDLIALLLAGRAS